MYVVVCWTGTVFSKLQSFLPVMEQENKKLEEAVAAGEGAKHSIEVDEDEAQTAHVENEGGAEKPPVIEMVHFLPHPYHSL